MKLYVGTCIFPFDGAVVIGVFDDEEFAKSETRRICNEKNKEMKYNEEGKIKFYPGLLYFELNKPKFEMEIKKL